MELAEQWKTVLQKVISESLWGQEFNRRHPAGRLVMAAMVAGAVLVLLPLLASVRWLLRRDLRHLRDTNEVGSVPASAFETVAAEESGVEDTGGENTAVKDIEVPSRQPQLVIESTGRLIETLSIAMLRQQGLGKQTRNLLEMGLLISGLLQLTLVAAGIGGIAIVFPASRLAALVLNEARSPSTSH